MKNPEIAAQMIPQFPGACKRLTPGPGYLEALVEDNLDFVHDGIKRFTEDDIETVDGKNRKMRSFSLLVSIHHSKPQFLLIDIRDKNKDESDDYISLGVAGLRNIFCSWRSQFRRRIRFTHSHL